MLPIKQTKRCEPPVSFSFRSRYASPIITVRTRMSSTDVLVFDTANDSTSKTKSLNGGDCSLSAISPVVLHASIVGSFGEKSRSFEQFRKPFFHDEHFINEMSRSLTIATAG